MSAALTMAEIRSGALESPGDFLRRVAGIVSQASAPDPAPEVTDWLYRVSVDLDATGGDLSRVTVPASEQEAMRVAKAILAAAEGAGR